MFKFWRQGWVVRKSYKDSKERTACILRALQTLLDCPENGVSKILNGAGTCTPKYKATPLHQHHYENRKCVTSLEIRGRLNLGKKQWQRLPLPCLTINFLSRIALENNPTRSTNWRLEFVRRSSVVRLINLVLCVCVCVCVCVCGGGGGKFEGNCGGGGWFFWM